MKKLLVILLFCACNGGLTSTHEVRYSPDGKDSVVRVAYYDGHQFTSFYMNYPLFKALYDSVGYEGCYDYARAHELPAYWLREYSKYKKLKDSF